LPNGQSINVAGGTTCSVSEAELALDFPSWWGPVTLPIWRPNIADATVVRDAIAGHVSVNSGVPGKEPLSRNTLVYFVDWKSEKPLAALSAALGKVKSSFSLMAIVVVPPGVFDATRRELEQKIASSQDSKTVIHLTEDDEGGWSRMFAVGKTPSAYLINARRACTWKHEGELDPIEWAAALDRYLSPTSAPRFKPLRLAISIGDLPP